MKSIKDLTIMGVFVALLIGGQFALFAVSGIEIVTVLFASFVFCFGIVRSLIVGTAFSLLRCFVFGFMPNVLILYLIYYNLFALVIGFVGNKMDKSLNLTKTIVIVCLCALLTALFTGLDNIISPLYYGMTGDVLKAYLVMSLSTMFPQIICTILTVSTIFPALVKLYKTTIKTI